MRPQDPLPPPTLSSRLVGVIASPAGLAEAVGLDEPPDLFELRLDALHDSLGQVERAIPRLRAPLIVTARHPAEGGFHGLGPAARRALLERFMDHAAFIDLEARLEKQTKLILAKIRRRKIGLILSVHLSGRRLTSNTFLCLTTKARIFRPDIFKLVVPTDSAGELDALISLFANRPPADFQFAAMGLGKLALDSRLALERLGSALTYGAVGEPVIPGQPSLSQLREARRAYKE